MRLIILCILIIFTTTGCNENSFPEAAGGHSLIKDYTSFKADNALNEAKIYLRAGDIENAIFILEKFVTYRPNNPLGHLYLSKAYEQTDEFKKSVHHMKRAFMLDNTLSEELAGPVLGKGVVGRVFATNRVNEEKNLALKPKAWFDKDTKIIYASLEIINAPVNTEIETEWAYELAKNEQVKINSTRFKAEGSKNTLVSLEKPTSGWPIGKYRLNVIVNGYYNTDLIFYVF